MGKISYYLLAFLVGGTIAVHLSMNADVGAKLGNPRAANAIFWIIGAAAATIIWLASPNRSAITEIGKINPALLLAGVMGASLVLATAVVIPKIGAGPANVTLLTAQLVTAVIISHFGLWSSPQQSITIARIMGMAIMAGGASIALLL